MTEKKELILQKALALFSEKGYDNTPTSLIAKQAGVSEGLIFRHFENKEGLFKAILEEGEKILESYINEIITETNYQKRIFLIIDLVPTMMKKERDFWTLHFTLKFNNSLYAKMKYQQKGFLLLFNAATEALEKLNFENSIQETHLLWTLLEGLTSQLIVQQDHSHTDLLIDFIKNKYTTKCI